MSEDVELLEAWRNGDQKAGSRLFERHFDGLYAFFQSKAPDVVEDLIQQTLTQCVESRDKFRGESTFRSYMFGIGRHVLYDHYRRKHRQPRMDASSTSLFDLGPSPSTMAAQNAQERLLADALVRLPLDFQIALELHYWEDMSTAELAAVLEIPHGTAKSRLRRAKELLREQLDELAGSPQDVESTLGDLGRWALGLRDQLPRRE